MSPKIHPTKDGSSTLYSEQFSQYYHNPNGAATESLHVFFESSGLNEYLETATSLTILEIGFGTGLNFLLLLDILKQRGSKIPVKFYSIEAFPVSAETADEFDFSGHINHQELNDVLPDIFKNLQPGINHKKPVGEVDAELNLFIGKFEAFKPDELQADFIFHDPFSPEVNEELWTDEVFKKLRTFSKPTTVLATYCAASKARGAMCASNWHVARATGALGKREMTLASPSKEKLKQFKRVDEKRLKNRYLNNDF
ncbi:MAG: tRNA (5-methylaminomethyl-2-thiouridine)(34)-methyltransferase MnmD [Gracilimonas sp.]|uniref:tRNA (5-methylaminomethyl-2-thiouridine)(34)-methyltransferase MnmD n=1 Tax=Gracilimonas sp. TaxID=1974203 RepID=UPI00198BA32C|nr:tRNA (5-methylaminomethyl-2-thiouridine)(34)-methyltransferase MnmD [Gracilimonas sp.]MBD3616488.1 tRNA (5-methylaminomethyl-2-thiouridine)(34)-methyltransferase MnmD [Gracilimonas sp.]